MLKVSWFPAVASYQTLRILSVWLCIFFLVPAFFGVHPLWQAALQYKDLDVQLGPKPSTVWCSWDHCQVGFAWSARTYDSHWSLDCNFHAVLTTDMPRISINIDEGACDPLLTSKKSRIAHRPIGKGTQDQTASGILFLVRCVSTSVSQLHVLRIVRRRSSFFWRSTWSTWTRFGFTAGWLLWVEDLSLQQPANDSVAKFCWKAKKLAEMRCPAGQPFFLKFQQKSELAEEDMADVRGLWLDSWQIWQVTFGTPRSVLSFLKDFYF